jgi:hypothetical protein
MDDFENTNLPLSDRKEVGLGREQQFPVTPILRGKQLTMTE